MFLTGTLLNAVAVLAGGLLGTFLGDRLPTRVRDSVMAGVGLFAVVMGVKFALETQQLLYLLFSVVIGGAIGSALSLDRRLNELGDTLQRRFGSARGSVSEAFVMSSIVFCVGPLTFLGAIQNGLTDDPTLLVIKSVLDGTSAIAFAASLGWGVLLSIPVILVYQGGVAGGASFLQGALSDAQLQEMSATGGVLLVGVGLRLLRIRDVAVADFLPAILLAPLLVAVARALVPALP